MTQATVNPSPQTPTVSVSSPSLLNSFRSEWHKLASLRSPWIVTGVVAIVTVIPVLLLARFVAIEDPGANGVLGSLSFVNYLGVIAVVVVGALIGSGDFQHKTSVATLTQQPKRWQFLTAKIGFGLATSVAITMALIAAAFAAAAIYLGPGVGEMYPIVADAYGPGNPDPISFFEVMPISIAHMILAGLFGLGLGLATRSTAIAISGFFVMRFIEVVAVGVTTHWITNLFPFGAGNRLLPFIVQEDQSRFSSDLASAVTYCSTIALLLAVGVFRTYKQDIS